MLVGVWSVGGNHRHPRAVGHVDANNELWLAWRCLVDHVDRYVVPQYCYTGGGYTQPPVPPQVWSMEHAIRKGATLRQDDGSTTAWL